MDEEFKNTEFEQWEKIQSRWLHFQMSLGRFRDVTKMAFNEGIDIGYKKGLESKKQHTTISDCPLPDGDREAYIKKLLQSDIDKHNKIAALSRKVYDLQKQSNQLTEAKALLKQWMQTTQANGCDNINIVADTEAFLKE